MKLVFQLKLISKSKLVKVMNLELVNLDKLVKLEESSERSKTSEDLDNSGASLLLNFQIYIILRFKNDRRNSGSTLRQKFNFHDI